MNRSRVIPWSVLLLALALLVPALSQAQARRDLNPQPVLIYTVSGSTIAGETLETLIIYDNGLAILSNLEGGAGGDCDVQTAQVTQQEINMLLFNLRRAGALRRNVQVPPTEPVPDVPLTTVTIFFNPAGVGSPGRTLAQTFSFFAPEGTRARINDVISNFLNDTFDTGGL